MPFMGADNHYPSSQNIQVHELCEGQRVDACHSSLAGTAMRERTGSTTDCGNDKNLDKAQETGKHKLYVRVIFLKLLFLPNCHSPTHLVPSSLRW